MIAECLLVGSSEFLVVPTGKFQGIASVVLEASADQRKRT